METVRGRLLVAAALFIATFLLVFTMMTGRAKPNTTHLDANGNIATKFNARYHFPVNKLDLKPFCSCRCLAEIK